MTPSISARINRAPVIITNCIELDTHGVKILDHYSLLAYDPDTPAAEIQFKAYKCGGGYFASLSDDPTHQVVRTQFTQAEINAGDIIFVHTQGRPGCILQANDGQLYSAPEQCNIKPYPSFSATPSAVTTTQPSVSGASPNTSASPSTMATSWPSSSPTTTTNTSSAPTTMAVAATNRSGTNSTIENLPALNSLPMNEDTKLLITSISIMILIGIVISIKLRCKATQRRQSRHMQYRPGTRCNVRSMNPLHICGQHWRANRSNAINAKRAMRIMPQKNVSAPTAATATAALKVRQITMLPWEVRCEQAAEKIRLEGVVN